MLSLADWAAVADVATASVAAVAYGRYLSGSTRRRRALEEYLKNERPGKRDAGDQGRRTVLHLVSALRMSEEEILKAAFDSKRIRSTTAETKRAAALFLEYER